MLDSGKPPQFDVIETLKVKKTSFEDVRVVKDIVGQKRSFVFLNTERKVEARANEGACCQDR
jgi:hypothetical protein